MASSQSASSVLVTGLARPNVPRAASTRSRIQSKTDRAASTARPTIPVRAAPGLDRPEAAAQLGRALVPGRPLLLGRPVEPIRLGPLPGGVRGLEAGGVEPS